MCDVALAFLKAAYFIVWLWLGQYVFVSMFLGLILEKFSVDEFMDIKKKGELDDFITEEQAMKLVAAFQRLPVDAVCVCVCVYVHVYVYVCVNYIQRHTRK